MLVMWMLGMTVPPRQRRRAHRMRVGTERRRSRGPEEHRASHHLGLAIVVSIAPLEPGDFAVSSPMASVRGVAVVGTRRSVGGGGSGGGGVLGRVCGHRGPLVVVVLIAQKCLAEELLRATRTVDLGLRSGCSLGDSVAYEKEKGVWVGAAAPKAWWVCAYCVPPMRRAGTAMGALQSRKAGLRARVGVRGGEWTWDMRRGEGVTGREGEFTVKLVNWGREETGLSSGEGRWRRRFGVDGGLPAMGRRARVRKSGVCHTQISDPPPDADAAARSISGSWFGSRGSAGSESDLVRARIPGYTPLPPFLSLKRSEKIKIDITTHSPRASVRPWPNDSSLRALPWGADNIRWMDIPIQDVRWLRPRGVLLGLSRSNPRRDGTPGAVRRRRVVDGKAKATGKQREGDGGG
ncbi:hypothetical protein FA13DRAFT_1776142 [Coprinellus micaceus]|uniref:Uncharacterized protein n=1 Tax=Coprinellus micaceus TaxID=71717 RepID=A0A4Y7T1P6_COPMI|nr:hypothetical protein FA13DRAFT_1776142 [Coprinellus micaceus]